SPDIYYFNLALSDAPHPQFSNAEGTNQGVTLLNPLQQDARLTPTLRVDWRRPRPHVFAEDQTGSFGDINQFAMPTASELEPWRENMHALPILFMFAGVPQAHRVSKVRFNETTGELLLYEAANNEEKVFMTLSKTQLDIYSAFLLQVFSYSDVMAHPAFVLAWREEFNRLTQVIEAQTGVKGVGEVFGQVVQRLSPIEEEIHFETMQHDEKFKAQLAKGDKLVAEPFAKILKGTTYLFDSEGIPIAARRFDQNQRITEVRPLTRQQKNDAMEYIERVEDKKFENDPTHRKLVSAMKEDIEGALKTMRKSIKNAFVPENGAEHFDKDVMAGHFLEPHRYFPDMRALSRGERAHLPDNAEEAVVALSREVRPVAPTNEEMRDAMAGSGTSHMMESFLSEVQRTRERMEKAQPGRLHEVETELDLYDYLKQKGPYELKGKNQKERRRGFFRKPVHPKGLVAWQFENDTELNGSVNSLPLRLFHTEEGGAAVLAPSGSPYRTIRLKFGENTMTDSVKTVREFNVETQGVVACGNFLVFLPPEGSTGRKAISRVIDLSTYVNADLIPRFFMPFQVDLSKAHIVEARGNHDKITLKYEDYETREVKETVVLLSDIEDIVREQTKLHMRFSAFADFAHFDSPKFQERIQEVREALKEALASETLKAPEAVALEIDAALDEFVDTAIHLRSLEAADDTPLLQKKKKIGLILQETTAKLAKRYKFFGRMGLATQILNDYEPLQGRGLLACILIAAASISVAHAVSPDAVQEHAMQVTHIMYAMSQAFTNAISEGFFLAAEAAKDMFAFFKPSVFKELLSHRAAIAITAALGGTFLGVGVVMSLAQGYGVWKSRRDPEYESFEERWIKEKEKSKESLHYVKRLRIADAARCRNAYYAAKLKGTLLENEGWTEFKDRWIEEQRGKGEGDGGLVVETVICPRDRRALNRDYLLFIQKEEAIRNGMTPMEADELTYRQAVIRLFWSYAGFKGLLAITTRAQNYFNYAKNSISWDTPFNIFFPEIKATALRGATPRFENGAWRFQVFPRLLPYEKRAREQYLLLGELKLREKVALCAMDETYRYMKDERDKFEAEKKQVGPPLKRDELHDFLRTLKPQGQLFLRVLYNELFIRLYGRVVAFHDEHHGELPLTDTLIERWVQEIKGEVSVEAQDYVEKNPVIRFWDSLKYRDVRFRIANFIVQRFSKPSYFKKRLLEFKDAMANDPQALERAARETLSTIKVDKWQDYIFLILLGLGSSGEQAPLQPEFMGPLSFCYLSRRRWNNVVWDIYHTLFGGPWIKVLQDINLRNSAEVFDKEFNERPKNPNISFARHYFNSTFSRENSWWHNQKRSLQMSFSNWKSYVINLIILSLPALGFIDIESILFGYTLGAILGGWYMMLEQGFERATGYALTDITDQQLRDPYMQQIARQRLQRLRDRFNLVQNFYFNIEGMFQTIFFYNAVADPNTGQNVYRAGMKFLMRPLFGDKGMAGWLHEEFKELAQEYPSMADTLHSLDTVFTKNHPDFAKPDGMYYQDTHPGTAEAPLPSGD
ncbi:MAG TPA: hypothetical protein VJB34_06635, partial [Bdellovibrionota bacterium]|nr:hypothetical protein [Bdellovibrionota bacterium]